MTPNKDQIISLLSTVLKIAGVIIVGHGTFGVTGAMWEQISGGVIMIAPIVFDMFHHTDANTIATVAAMPDVEKIVVQPNATDGAGAALKDPTQTKVVSS